MGIASKPKFEEQGPHRKKGKTRNHEMKKLTTETPRAQRDYNRRLTLKSAGRKDRLNNPPFKFPCDPCVLPSRTRVRISFSVSSLRGVGPTGRRLCL